MVGAEDCPLEKREAGLGKVNVNDAAHHFAPGVVNPFVAGEVWRHFPIGDMAVGNDMRGIVHIEANEGAHGSMRFARHWEQAGFAVALDQGHDRDFVALKLNPLLAEIVGRIAADVGFVHFDGPAATTKFGFEWFLSHGVADAMAKVPCGFVGDPEASADLVRGNAFLGRTHEVNGQEPFRQRDMRILENGPDLDRVLLLTGSTLAEARTGGLAGDLILALRGPAMRAGRAVRPNEAFDKGYGLGFIGEVWGHLCEVHDLTPIRALE